jgi:hypothetical protein
MRHRFRLALLPLMGSILLGAGPILTGCSDGPTSSGTCCKICRTGKPCGDTCIDQSETCHTSGGCACAG